MSAHYDPVLVALSVSIAILASFTALALAQKRGAGWTERLFSATAMATGVWTMHFIAMLAFHLPTRIAYDLSLTLLSLVPVFGASALAFHLVRTARHDTRRLLIGGLCLGAGVAAMHYTGMAALRMAPPIRYDPWLFFLSLLIAFAASCGGLYFAFHRPPQARWGRFGAAVAMGTAVSGMHYTGMAAAHFAPDCVSLASPWALPGERLPGVVAGGALLVLLLSLFFSLAEPIQSFWRLLVLIVGGEIAIMAMLDSRPSPGSPLPGNLWYLDGLLLGLFLLPILYRLKRDSRQLAYEKERAGTTLASIGDAVIVTDAAGRVEFLNPRAERLMGRASHEVRGRPLEEVFPVVAADTRQPLGSFAARCLRHPERAALPGEAVLFAGDGTERRIENSLAPIWGEQGDIRGLVLVFRDVTERSLAEQRLSEAREELRRGLQHQSALNTLLRAPLDRLSLDELLSHVLEIILATPWLALLPRGGIFLMDPVRGDLVLKASHGLPARVLETCQRVRLSCCLCGRAAASGALLFAGHLDERHEIRHEGMEDHGHYCVPIMVNGRTLGLLALYVEAGHVYSGHEAAFLEAVGSTLGILVQRKLMEDQLRLSETVFRHAGEGIVITDAGGNIVRVNRAFETITGYSESEVLGHNPRLLSSGRQDRSFYENVWQSLKEHGEWQGEIWNRNKKGEIYPEWLSIRAVPNEKGELEHYVGIFADISEFKNALQRIERLAYYDHLTGLANRGLLLDHLKVAVAQARRQQQGVAVMFLDLDRFKAINDSLGHDAGDRVLLETARRLSSSVREGDTVARLGGDEFVLCLNDIGTDSARAVAGVDAIAAKLRRRFVEPIRVGERELVVTPSIGVALYPWDGETPEELIKNADTAMYHAKKQGGGDSHRFYARDMSTASLARLELQSGLRRALERDEFELHFQPQVDIGSGLIVGSEALLRWRHPQQGWIPPARFLAVAEESNLILPIGDWILRAACRQTQQWREQGYRFPGGALRIAVNVSPRQFNQPDFAERIAAVLKEHGLGSDCLEIEVTEETLMQRSEAAAETLKRLKHLGLRIAVDDFGVGYSSLNYLKRFPVDVLKIDRSFIQDIATDPNDAAIVKAMAALADSLNLDVVAEGVETEEQLALLRQMGCGEYQGFLFSRPLPAPEFATLLMAGEARQRA
jgi:diguanylate cyclase (GGDEF)-like protein/PAS domain S-box-containing protein